MSKKPIIKNDYIMIPINYIEQLQENDRRDKARAFMEYFYDMASEKVNSFEFYSKSWSVSLCTVAYWTKEFSREIDTFFSKFLIGNQEHYNITLDREIDFKSDKEKAIDV